MVKTEQQELKNQRLAQSEHKHKYQGFIENKRINSTQNIPKIKKSYYPERLKNGEKKSFVLIHVSLLNKFPILKHVIM